MEVSGRGAAGKVPGTPWFEKGLCISFKQNATVEKCL